MVLSRRRSVELSRCGHLEAAQNVQLVSAGCRSAYGQIRDAVWSEAALSAREFIRGGPASLSRPARSLKPLSPGVGQTVDTCRVASAGHKGGQDQMDRRGPDGYERRRPGRQSAAPRCGELVMASATWPASSYSGPLTVCAIDLGASGGLAAYHEHYDAAGSGVTQLSRTAYTADGVRRSLVENLKRALNQGTVALGLEGPCWGMTTSMLGPYVRRDFENNQSAWYGRSGGPAAVKAVTLLQALLAQLGTAVQVITYGRSSSLGHRHVLWVWEAFVFGQAKSVVTQPALLSEGSWTFEERARTSKRSASSASGDIRDAFSAVRFGFANNPLAIGPRTNRVTVPLIGPVVAATGCFAAGEPDRCLVVEPDSRNGRLHWP
jgi:hypothetical protein